MEQMHFQSVRFLCEQDGPHERAVKQKFADLFADRGDIELAYLAAVQYAGRSDTSVALCLHRKKFEAREQDIARDIGSVFAIFPGGAALDIIFLSEAQGKEITKVCRAFYGADQK